MGLRATYPQHVCTSVCTRKRRSPAISVITGLSILTMRSEADFDRRMAVVAYDVLTQATAKIRGGCSQPAQKPAPRCARLAFLCLSLPLQARSSVRTAHKKTPSLCLGLLLGWRSEADSNRCSSFCRAEPSHSAIGPKLRCDTPGLQIYENERGRLHLNRGKCTFAA